MVLILLSGLLLLFGLNLNADWTERSPRLSFHHTGSDLTPLVIRQSPDGWLWIAAKQGFFRFDGHRFFPLVAPAGMDLSEPRDIAVGPGSTVWLGTAKGLYRWEADSLTLALPLRIENVMVSRRGYVYVSGTEPIAFTRAIVKLFVLAPDQKTWREIEAYEPTTLTIDRRGNLLCTNQVQVARIDEDALRNSIQRGQRLDKVVSNFPGLGDSHATRALWRDLARDSTGGIWARAGTEVYHSLRGTVQRYSVQPLDQARIHDTFFEDSRNRLWVMGAKLQLAIPDGLIGAPRWTQAFRNITALFEDNRGTLWIGQESQGLTAVLDDHVLMRWDQSAGLESSVNSIARDAQGTLFAGTDAGIRWLDGATGNWVPWGDLKQRIPSLVVTASGSLLATPKHPEPLGAYSFFEYSSTQQPASRKNFLWDNHPAYFRPRLAVSAPDGVDWLAAVEQAYRRNRGGDWKPVFITGGNYISDIQPVAKGEAYVGHENGVSYCRENNCQPVIRMPDGLLNFRVRSIAVKPDEIWIAYRTNGGFSRYQKTGDRWQARHFLATEGYGPPDTHFLRKDARGWIWRGTPEGVFVCDGVHVEPEDWIQLRFGSGPKDSDANLYGFFEESPESLLIGTAAGVVRIFPRSDWFAPTPPRLVGVRANGESLRSLPPDRLPANAALELDFARPGEWPFLTRQLRYRMRPHETSWTLSTDGTLRYPRLAHPFRRELQLELSGLSKAIVIPVQGIYDFWAGVTGILLPVASGGSIWWFRRRRAARRLEAERAEYEREKQKFLEAQRLSNSSLFDWTGTTLSGRYMVESLVARGGFASVYRGTDQSNQAAVAVKVLHPIQRETEWRQRRFVAEVETLTRLKHPGILQLYTHGEAAPGQPFLVTEWIEGQTLRAALADGPLAPGRAHKLIADLAEALATAHTDGVLHRDLKPENIMLRIRDGIESPVLIDFGIATIAELEDPAHSTQLAGSLGYVAPERWFGPASPASDVYSLAAIAIELYTGTRYADSGNKVENLQLLFAGEQRELIRSSLSLDPKERPADAGEFLRRWRA